jgi:hypothetical protein
MQKLITNILVVVAIGWISVLTVMLIRVPKAKIGFVDTQQLIATQAQQFGRKSPSNQELQILAAKIKTTVANYALDNNLILIAKNAIWGGELIDYTAEIIALLVEGSYE